MSSISASSTKKSDFRGRGVVDDGIYFSNGQARMHFLTIKNIPCCQFRIHHDDRKKYKKVYIRQLYKLLWFLLKTIMVYML